MPPLGQFVRVLWPSTLCLFFLLFAPTLSFHFHTLSGARFFSLWYNGAVLLSEQCQGVSGAFRAHRGGGILCISELLFKRSFLKQQMIHSCKQK